VHTLYAPLSAPLHALLITALCAGCVSRHRHEEEVRALSSKVAVLEDKVDEAKELITRLKAELDRAQDAVALKTAELERAHAALSRSRSDAGALQEEVEQVRLALAEAEARQARVQAALDSYRNLVGRFQGLIDAGTLQVKVVRGQMVVELATDVLFEAGAADLSPEGARAIAEVGLVLAGLSDRSFQVMGHTDDRPIASARFPSNWHLGAARAIAVTELLVRSGLQAHRITAASAGEFLPTAPNRTPEGRASNRRIEILVVPDLALLPGYEELQQLGRGVR
jgi:chemotaxis protein MotB